MTDEPQIATHHKTTSWAYGVASAMVVTLGIIVGLFVCERLYALELQEMEHSVDQKVATVHNTFRNTISKYYFTLHGLAKILAHPDLSKKDRQSLWKRLTNGSDGVHRENDVALKDVYYISYAPNDDNGISCILEEAYLNQEAEQEESKHRQRLKSHVDLCKIKSAETIFNRVKTTRAPQLIALEDLGFRPILRKDDAITEVREPALVYPFYNKVGALKGWIIGAIDLQMIQHLLRDNQVFGAHIDVYDVSRLGIRPIMSNMLRFMKQKPFTKTRQVGGITRTIHLIPKGITPLKQFPSEIRYFFNGRYHIETQLFIAGRRLLVAISSPSGYTLYPPLAGAAVCLLFVILALIIYTQSRVRARADTLAVQISKQLHKSEDRLKAAAEGSNDGIWDWDIENDVVWFSKRYYEILGYENNAFAASFQAFKSRIHPEDLPIITEALKEHLKSRAPYSPTFRIQHKQGHYIWVHSRGQARFVNGRAVRMAGVHTDISHEKKQQFELAEAQRRAEEAAEVKALFLANMSHEIRTPLNGIVGISELLSQTPLNGRQLQYVSTLRDSSETLMQIVNDILDYSKLEAKKMPLESIPFSFTSAMEGSLALSMPAIEKRGNIELIYRYAPKLPTQFIGDPTRIRQIVINLLSNAIKFTESGYVFVDIDGSPSKSKTNHYDISITVEDTGIGMDAVTQKNLFDKFTQADDSTTRKYGGTGLGLSIIHELVKLLNGQITLTSTLNEGSKFVVTFPMELSEQLAETTNAATPLYDTRILVVDEQPRIIALLKESLELDGAYVDGCTDSTTVLKIIEEQIDAGYPYKAVILNHTMKHSGPKLAIDIKNNPKLRDTHLLLMTAQGRKGDGKKMRALGFEAYLAKPVIATQVCFALSGILEAAKSGHEPVFITRHSYTEYNYLDNSAALPRTNEKHTKSSVLVVEDNSTNQQVITWMLDDLGVQYHVAENGKKAIDILEETENIGLILMDCHMPVMDGLTATRLIRKRSDALAHIPIIALSANNQPSDRDECIEAGMDTFVSKPIERAELLKILTEKLPEFYTPDAAPIHVPADTPSEHLESLNAAKLLDLTSGAKHLTQKFLDMFDESVNAGIEGMRKALIENDAKQLKHHAHTLKGAAANLCAEEMKAIAATLEEMSKNNDFTVRAAAEIEGFIAAYARFQLAATALLETLDDD